MSSKRAIITERDVTRILRGAAAAGISYTVIVSGGEARFVPVDGAKATDEPSELEAWRARRDARKAGGRA